MPAVRIISGQAKGRKIPVPDGGPDLRPSTDRVRTTAFNWLMPLGPFKTVLDCFCGSGILGLEALSRGAQHCIFIDTSTEVKRHLIRLQENWRCGKITSLKTDAIMWLQQPDCLNKPTTFDLVFLDPPFAQPALLYQSLELLKQHWVSPDSIVYLETDCELTDKQLEGWHCHRHKAFGRVQSYLLKSI